MFHCPQTNGLRSRNMGQEMQCRIREAFIWQILCLRSAGTRLFAITLQKSKQCYVCCPDLDDGLNVFNTWNVSTCRFTDGFLPKTQSNRYRFCLGSINSGLHHHCFPPNPCQIRRRSRERTTSRQSVKRSLLC